MSEPVMVLQAAINHLWQSAVLTAALLLLFFSVRDMSVAARHWLAFAGLIATAVLPAAAWLPDIAMGDVSLQAAWSPALAAGTGSGLPPIEALARPSSHWDLTAFATLALIVWCVGAGIGLIRLAADAITGAALARRSPCVPLPSRFQSLLPLDLRESGEVQDPIVLGFLRPSVIVPIGLLDRHGETELHAVLAHEKAHIDRADPMAALLQRLIVVTFWWNPMLRVLSRHIDEAREMACDEAAARRVGDARIVARALTEFVHQRHCHGTVVHGVGLRGSRAFFTRRIRRLMDAAADAPPRAIHRLVAVALPVVIAGIAVATPRFPATEPPALARPAAIASVPSAAQPDATQPSALSIAIARADSDMLRGLIRAGADVRAAEARGEKLLLSAVQADNTGLVEALVSAGADAGAAQARGEPVLAEAVSRGNSGIARLLLRAGARAD